VSAVTLSVWMSLLQGQWKVISSSGRAEDGHVFVRLVGAKLIVKRTTLTLPDHRTKTIELAPRGSLLDIDLVQTPDAQGWSRVGVAALAGDRLTLSVQFPQNARPSDLSVVDDGREVVVLERVR
jgi:uncharacterized protein (TIGR03067 family)